MKYYGYDRGKKSRSNSLSVDIAFCIDATSCMQPFMESFQDFATTFHTDLQNSLKNSVSENIDLNLRVRAIAFKDLKIGEQMLTTPFLNLPEDSDDFCAFFGGKKACGGGDEPDSAIEALILAIRSDWVQDLSSRKLHFIVLFSNANV